MFFLWKLWCHIKGIKCWLVLNHYYTLKVSEEVQFSKSGFRVYECEVCGKSMTLIRNGAEIDVEALQKKEG